MEINKILAERKKTHGSFYANSRVSQEFKAIMYSQTSGASFSPEMREGLDMIFHKLSRIIAGNPNHEDHWDDIAGYATLVANSIRDKNQEYEMADGTEPEQDINPVYYNNRMK